MVSRFLPSRELSINLMTLHRTTSAKTRATATLRQRHIPPNVMCKLELKVQSEAIDACIIEPNERFPRPKNGIPNSTYCYYFHHISIGKTLGIREKSETTTRLLQKCIPEIGCLAKKEICCIKARQLEVCLLWFTCN